MEEEIIKDIKVKYVVSKEATLKNIAQTIYDILSNRKENEKNAIFDATQNGECVINTKIL